MLMATDTGSVCVQTDTELPAFQGFKNRHMHKSVCSLYLQSVAVQLNAYDLMAVSASFFQVNMIILTCFCIITKRFSLYTFTETLNLFLRCYEKHFFPLVKSVGFSVRFLTEPSLQVVTQTKFYRNSPKYECKGMQHRPPPPPPVQLQQLKT